MKHATITLSLLIALAAFLGCSGDKGATGPTGPTGNANVMQFNLPGFTISSVSTVMYVPVPGPQADSSVVLVYVQTSSSFWYLMPGYVGGTYEYRLIIVVDSPDSTGVQIARTTGTGDQTFTAVRILVVPANVFAKPVAINWENYAEVARYLNLPRD